MLKPLLRCASRWPALGALAVAALLALPPQQAGAVPYFLTNDGLHRVTGFDLTSGGSDAQLSDSNETRGIWTAIDGGASVPGTVSANSKTYNVGAFENDTETVINYVAGGDFTTGNIALNSIGAGTIPFGSPIEDISVRARTYLAVPVGNWSISIASDDGRRLQLGDAQQGAPGAGGLVGFTTFNGSGEQIDSGSGSGFNFLLRNSTTGHDQSVGTFTVTPAQAEAGTNVVLIYLDGFYFERGTGGGSFEISIKSGLDTSFGGSGEGWTLLQQGTYGWSLSTTPITVTLASPTNSFTWDGSTDDWRAGAGSDTHWEPPALGNTLYATIADDATVNTGQANVASSDEAAFNLNIGAAGTMNVAAGRTLTVDSTLTIAAGGTLTNNGAVNAMLVNSSGAIALGNGSSLTAMGNTLGNVDIVGGTASLKGFFTATSLDFAANTTLNLIDGTLSAAAATLGGGTCTLDTPTGVSATLSSVSGAGGLTKSGAGTLTLNTANTYQGLTTVGAGVLNITHGGALGDATSGTVVNSGGQLRLGVNNLTVPAGEAISINGTGPGNGGAIYAQAGNNINIDGPVSLAGNAVINVAAGASARLRLRGGLALGANNLTVIVSGSGERFEIATNPMTGTGSLRLEGDGITELMVNSPGYSGAVDITNGIADTYGNGQGLGVGTINVDGDATLRFRNGVNLVNNVTLNGTEGGGTGQDQGRLHNENGANSLLGTLAVNSLSRIDVNAGSTLTLAGAVSGSGAIEKTDTGTLVLSGNNSFSGPVTVAGGTLRIGSSSALGTTAGGTSLTGGAALQLQGGINVPAEPLSLGNWSGSSESIVNLGGTNSFAGNITLGPATPTGIRNSATINSAAGSLDLLGAIDMNMSDLTVTGAGDTLVQGIISGTNTSTVITTGAGLRFGRVSGNINTSAYPTTTTVQFGPHVAKTQSGTDWPDNQTNTYWGQIYLDGSKSYNFIESIDDKTWLKIDGTVYINDGTWNNTTKSGLINKPTGWYQFELRMSDGGGGQGYVYVNPGFQYNDNGINTTNDADHWYPEDPGDGSLFRLAMYANPNDLTKTGAGTLTLNGNNNYNGTTDVILGKLLVNGTTSGQGTYTVHNGATLGGAGTIGLAGGASVDILAGGTVAPGLGPGTLTVLGSFVMGELSGPGAVYEWELGAGVEDLIAVSGALTLNNWVLRILDAGGDTYAWEKHYLFTGYSSLSGPNNVTFDLSQVPLWDEFTGTMEIGIDGGGVYLIGLNSTPEPGTLSLLLLGGLALVRRRKRSR